MKLAKRNRNFDNVEMGRVYRADPAMVTRFGRHPSEQRSLRVRFGQREWIFGQVEFLDRFRHPEIRQPVLRDVEHAQCV